MLRRVASDGAGWMSYATPRAEMRVAVKYVRARPEFVARPRRLGVGAYFVEATHDPVTHEETGSHRVLVGRDAVLEQLRYPASVGVDVTRVPLDARPGRGGKPEPISSVADYLERLEWFAAELMPEARTLRTSFE